MFKTDSMYEVNDRVLIMDGEFIGCTGKVVTVGAGGVLVVKPDPPVEHEPILLSVASVHIRELANHR
jgi:hypothetical protein